MLSCLNQAHGFVEEFSGYREFNLKDWVGLDSEENLEEFAGLFKDRLERAFIETNLLIPWSMSVVRRREDLYGRAWGT